jgi:glucans biosynthesis protein C
LLAFGIGFNFYLNLKLEVQELFMHQTKGFSAILSPVTLTQPAFAGARLVELDWLRVLVFGLLIFYHLGMLYAENWGWHYKSSYQSSLITDFMLWSNQWRMSLLFFISGAAVSFMLARQHCWQFLLGRIPLLLLPLVFGVLVVVVPQVYVEANSQGLIISPNYWHFWYLYLDQTSAEFAAYKTLGSLHLTWNHLWFLPYILVYSILLAVIYPLLNSTYLRPIGARLHLVVTSGMVVWLPCVALYGISFCLYDKNPVTHNFVQDWFNHARSFFCFLAGYGLVRLPEVWSRFASLRWPLLLSALCTYAYIVYSFHGGTLGAGPIAKQLNSLLWATNSWLWIITAIAWAQFTFRVSSPLLRYLNSGVFCFYIFHQTLIIVFAYYLVPLHLGALIEPVLLVLLVVAVSLLLFESIKRFPVVPILFGIQLKH